LFISIGKNSDRVQAKSKAIDTSVFQSRLINMLVMDELRKRNMEWEEFITSSNFHLNIAPTPQFKVQIPLQVDKNVYLEMNKKRKSIGSAKKDKETKEHVEEGGSYKSPQREVSPFPTPSPVETPLTRATGLRGIKLLFSSPPAANKVKARILVSRES
jgi:hypothetical protein